MAPSRRGRCLCGAVTYTVQGDPIIVAHCFCRDCQRQSGTVRTTGAVFREEQVELKGNIATFELTAESGHTVTRAFCPTCGAHLYGRNTGMTEVITLGVGTFDEPSDLAATVAVFTRNKLPSDAIPDGVASFETQPDWSPDNV